MTTEALTAHADGDLEAVIRTAYAAATGAKVDPHDVHTYLVPEGWILETPDLSQFLPKPTRVRATYRFSTLASFNQYLERFSTEDTTVWVPSTANAIVAVIDDSSPGDPQWGDHIATLTLETPPEWKYWLNENGKMLRQQEFAEIIEQGLPEILEPEAAKMLEIAQTFHAHTSTTFRSAIRLENGEQRIQYDTTINAGAGRSSELNVPTEMTLALSPFVGEDAYKVKARIGYRVGEGKLSLGYFLDRPERVVRDALDRIHTRLANVYPGQVYVGSPPIS
jgi:uncharacterized protein YfdQ (DUF2303 family)